MDKVHCVGFSKETLSERQRSVLTALVTGCAPALLGIAVHPNFDCVDVNNAMPHGVVLYMDPAAPVDATLLSDSLFQVTACARVVAGPYNGTLDDRHVAERLADINAAVPQHPAGAPDGTLTSAQFAEARPWTAEIGARAQRAHMFAL